MDVVATYLRNHWAAATAGTDLAQRVADRHRRTQVGGLLDAVANEISADRAELRRMMTDLGVTPGRLAPQAARLAERVGWLKPNGRIVRHSPVSSLLEIEALRSAVLAKRGGWESLQALDARAPDPVALLRLRGRADRQVERLTAAHRILSNQILGTPHEEIA